MRGSAASSAPSWRATIGASGTTTTERWIQSRGFESAAMMQAAKARCVARAASAPSPARRQARAGAAARLAADRERQEAAHRPEGARVLLGEHGRAREETRDDRTAGARRALGAEDEEGTGDEEEPERRVVHHLPMRHAPELEGDEP